MHRLIKFVALAASAVCLSSAASATVITFETSTQASASGMTLSGLHRLQCSTYFTQDTGYCRGIASGDWVAYATGGDAKKTDSSTFNFNGGYLTAAWNDNLNIEVLGYRNNAVVYSQTKVVSDDVATYFAFNYLNIDRVTFRSFGGTDAGTPGAGSHLAMDNLTFDQAAAVPEPGSLALLGLGVAGFALARRRTRV